MESLLASARRLTGADLDRRARGRVRRVTTRPWQEDVWELFDLVGEFRFLVTTLASRISQAKLYVGRIDPNDPHDDPIPVTDNRQIAMLLEPLGGTFAGRVALLRRLALNMLVVGDGWVVGIPRHLLEQGEAPLPGTPIALEDLEWRVFSTSEVSVGATTVELIVGAETDERLKVTPQQVYMIRVWSPHPRRWWESDSAARAALPILKELVGLTMHVSAQVDSRLAGAGLLIIPASATRAMQQAAGVEEGASEDQFTEALMEAMLTPIGDRGNASAIVPLVVTVPDEAADKFHHVTFAKPLDEEARNLREEAIRRLALSMDSPPELLLGQGDASHWSGWLVESDTVKSHLEPTLALISDAFTTQYLWPVLEEMGVEDYRSYVIWYDVAHLISRPNRGSDAMALYDKGVISDAALRRELGFDSDDAPNIEDPVTAVMVQIIQNNPGLLRSSALPGMISTLKAIMSGEPLPMVEAGPSEVQPGTAHTDASVAEQVAEDGAKPGRPSGYEQAPPPTSDKAGPPAGAGEGKTGSPRAPETVGPPESLGKSRAASGAPVGVALAGQGDSLLSTQYIDKGYLPFDGSVDEFNALVGEHRLTMDEEFRAWVMW